MWTPTMHHVARSERGLSRQSTLRIARRMRPVQRCGVTIMEVMFAIAIALFGLLGLTALIPAAARYGSDAVRIDETIQAGVSTGSFANAQRIANFDRLAIYCDDTTDPAAYGTATRRMLSVARRFATPPGPAIWGPATSQSPAVPSAGEIDSPGNIRFVDPTAPVNAAARTTVKLGRFGGFCIDPLQTPQTWSNALMTAQNAYRYGVFPYYRPAWNPVTAPTASPATSLGFPMPRLWRVPVVRDATGMPVNPFNVGYNEILDQTSANARFQLPGNPSQQTLKDKSFAAVRLFDSGTSSNPLFGSPIVGESTSRYSWFATLTPGPDAGTIYNLATVIVDGRIIETLPTTQLTEVRDHPSSERIAWAYDFIGFKGGAGGDVAIIASGSVVDRIRPGQWVMLSRQDYSASLPLAQRGPATHTWYRIVAADAPTIPEITTANFPYRFAGIDPSSPPANTSGMWSRVLTLDGPDWDFNLATPGTYGDDFLQDDTIVTIVDGAVEVIQSQVLIE